MSALNVPNLDKLIAHLEAQPPERINMAHCTPRRLLSGLKCGCIYVHAAEVLGDLDDLFGLGLSARQEHDLTQPPGCFEDGYSDRTIIRYPAHRVIATLKRLRDHYLATGEIVVDWGPEPTAGEPWAAPQATETNEAVSSPVAIPTPDLFDPPALPAEITRLLEPQGVRHGGGVGV